MLKNHIQCSCGYNIDVANAPKDINASFVVCICPICLAEMVCGVTHVYLQNLRMQQLIPSAS